MVRPLVGFINRTTIPSPKPNLDEAEVQADLGENPVPGEVELRTLPAADGRGRRPRPHSSGCGAHGCPWKHSGGHSCTGHPAPDPRRRKP